MYFSHYVREILYHFDSVKATSYFAEKQKAEKDNSKVILMTYVIDENEEDESVKSFNRDEL